MGTAPLVGRRGSSALGLSPLRGQDRPVIGYLCVERLLGPEATWLGQGQMQWGCGPASQVEIVHIPLELGVLGFLCSLGLRLFLQGRCGFDSPRYLAQLSVWANSFYLFIFKIFIDVFFGLLGLGLLHRLSLVVVSSLGLSVRASRGGGFPRCGAQALSALSFRSCANSVVLAHWCSCSRACGSSQIRDRTCVLCTGRQILIHCTTR